MDKGITLGSMTGREKRAVKYFSRPDDDPMTSKAIKMIVYTQRERKFASVSLLQRLLIIGYNQAADLFEKLQSRQLISMKETPGEPSYYREILDIPCWYDILRHR